MRLEKLLLGVVVLLGTAAAAAGAGADVEPLRIMTFNVRLNTPADGKNAWPHRKEMAASMIRFHRADAAGLQEALLGQNRDLAERLPGYEWIGVGRANGKKKGEYNSIFYRTERLQALEHDTFWLSESPSKPGSMGWDAACPRIVTWARFRDRRTGRQFYLFNTHFDHRGRKARRKSARLLLSRMRRIADGAPTVVTGDFNCAEGSAPYRILTEQGPLRDGFHASERPHHGPVGTFTGFDTGRPPERRIDYIFVTGGVRVLRHGTLSDRRDGRYPSDHLPVLAEGTVPAGG